MEFFVISRENHPVGRAALPPPTSLRNCQRRNGATSRNNHVIARPIGPWQSRGQWCRGKSTGSPRRFAPRNDGGGRWLILLFRVGGYRGGVPIPFGIGGRSRIAPTRNDWISRENRRGEPRSPGQFAELPNGLWIFRRVAAAGESPGISPQRWTTLWKRFRFRTISGN